jgi:DNA-binding MarR family transcriptional regulator
MLPSDRGDSPWPPLTVTRRSLLVDGSDRDFRHFVDSMVLFASRLQETRARLAAHMQVSPPQYRIVMALARAESPEMTATALAGALEVSTAFIVTEAQKLGDLGLVTRRKNPEDARSFLLALSAAGRARVTDLAPLMCLVNDALFADIDRATMQSLSRQAESLVKASVTALALLDVSDEAPIKPVRRARRTVTG